MPRKNSYITASDQFCGAGGSTQGALEAGVEIKLALNHWPLAVETYSTNNPNTLVDCTDVSACDPRRYPSTDILITSPECTTHSPAGGNNHKTLKKQMDLFHSQKIDPATERSRATMWDVCRFAEYHDYNIIIAENVVEAKTRWVLFDDWLRAMHTLGYRHRCLYLNSMHFHPTPQSRDRMYVVFWKKGNKAPILDYTPLAYCGRCELDVPSVQTWKRADRQYGKYQTQYVYCCPTCTLIVEPYYYASFNCIDWSDIGTRIGDRKKPLKPKSITRIESGRVKYGNYPFIVNDQHSTGIDFRVRSVNEHLPTLTTTHRFNLVTPFIIKGEHANVDPMTRSVYEPLQTQVTRQTMSLVTPPFVIMSKGQSKSRGILEPLSTQTQCINHGIISNDSWNSFIAAYYSTGNSLSHITEVLGTVTTKDRSALITYKEPSLEDCYFRMLKAREVKVAMAFGKDYVIKGNSRDQVKQLGNAVTPPPMKWLVQQCIESLR